jgi:hypothetical protein
MREHDAGLRRVLIGILGAIVFVDLVWAATAEFEVVGGAYLGIAAVSAGLFLGSSFYRRVRRDECLSAMLFGTGFLCAFSAAFSALNYFLLTIAGPQIDDRLAQVDRALGFDWPALVALAASHPTANFVLALAYVSVLPQIAILVVSLGVFGQWRTIYSLSLSVAVAAAVTVGFWTVFPSFGTLAVYQLDPELAANALLVVDAQYVREIVPLLTEGPGRIAPDQVKGLIAFPSFHAVLAVLIAWYARELRILNVAALGINILVLIATPIHGGHFVIDIVAGIAVALGAASLANRIVARLAGGVASLRGDRLTPVPDRAAQPSG